MEDCGRFCVIPYKSIDRKHNIYNFYKLKNVNTGWSQIYFKDNFWFVEDAWKRVHWNNVESGNYRVINNYCWDTYILSLWNIPKLWKVPCMFSALWKAWFWNFHNVKSKFLQCFRNNVICSIMWEVGWKYCQNPNLTSTQWLGLTRKWLCKPHKLNVRNISAVTDPILMKL